MTCFFGGRQKVNVCVSHSFEGVMHCGNTSLPTHIQTQAKMYTATYDFHVMQLPLIRN